MEGTTTITNVNQIKPLQDDLNKLAQETGVRMLQDYQQVDTLMLLEDISKISSSLSHLSTDDRVSYITKEERIGFNLEFRLAPESIEELYTQEVLTQENILIMKVKKADFLGDSMWEFRFGDRNIPVKISDKEWLEKFQTNKISVRPGDAIRGFVRVTHKYDTEHNLISYNYELLSVTEVIKISMGTQGDMFNGGRRGETT